MAAQKIHAKDPVLESAKLQLGCILSWQIETHAGRGSASRQSALRKYRRLVSTEKNGFQITRVFS
jgi:hypothetical protein